MNEKDKQRVKRIISNRSEVIKYSGLTFFSGKMDSRYNVLSKEQKVKILVNSALSDLTNITFDSDHYNESSYLNLRLIHLEENYLGKTWCQYNTSALNNVSSLNLYDKDSYPYRTFVNEAGITDSEFRTIVNTLIQYASTKI